MNAKLSFAAVPFIAGLLMAVPSPALAVTPVFDSTNYAQNLLQAARALEQLNHQVESLQNEAVMLENMARNLKRIDFPQLGQMTSALDRIDTLMDKAKAIDFKVGSIDEKFRELFPRALDTALKTDQRVAGARARLDAAMDAFAHSMAVQSEVVSNIKEDKDLLADLIERSQDAEGALQAQQATNQLMALSAKQQLQVQELMASEYRAQAIERARRAEAEAEARAATTRFLGTAKAYSTAHE